MKKIINSYDSRIKQHRDIYAAALKAKNYEVYLIPVDPIFRKCQEAGKAPQGFKIKGRGMKDSTIAAFEKLDKDIWK